MKKIFILASLFSVLGCNEVMVTIPDFELPRSERVILIEELTGVSCPNCPNGAAELQRLIELYDHKVIGVSIHGEFLAEPVDQSKFDFRSALANNMENKLKPYFGKPAAVINRVQQEGYEEYSVSNIDLWSGFVEEAFSKPAQLAIELTTTYNDETRELTINSALIPKEDISGDLRINVMITESHIWDAQKFPSTVESNYEHNHMLRDMLTSLDGDDLGTDLQLDVVVNREFKYNIPEDPELFVPENMDVILFITKVDGSSEQVIQAAEAHVLN